MNFGLLANMKKLFSWQVIILLAGTLFAWYTIIIDFLRFYDIEGTIFRVQDCAFPNPVVTPCFWGALAFLIALIWAIKIKKFDIPKQKKQQKFLIWFLIAGNIFAWSNFTYGLVKFLLNQGEPTIGCSGQLVSNPLMTPCFWGATLFLLGLIMAAVTYFKLKSHQSDQ